MLSGNIKDFWEGYLERKGTTARRKFFLPFLLLACKSDITEAPAAISDHKGALRIKSNVRRAETEKLLVFHDS